MTSENHDKKHRLDIILVEMGYADSREKAKHMVKGGDVSVNKKVILKPGKIVKENSLIEVRDIFRYVGRGGYKIDDAVNHFKIDFHNKTVADMGCSTGGFTDYALQHGAKEVYAIDIGDTLHDSLRQHGKVVYLPNTDARIMGGLPQKIDICLIDVTFSSITNILSIARGLLVDHGTVLGLIKPPFEVGKVKKIQNYGKALDIAKGVGEWADKNGYIVIGITESKLKGKTSNQQEFFICLTKR